MKKSIWLLFALSIFAGCSKSVTPKEGVISIDVMQKPKRIQDAGIIKDHELIPLESSAKIIVDDIDKIIAHEGLIYIANYRSSSNVIIFDEQGRFVREIKRRGRGPLEYLQLKNVFIDEFDNTLNLVDSYPAKILKFPLDGAGNPSVIHIANISLGDVMPYPEGYICYTTFSSQNERKTLLMIDRKGEVIGRDIRMRDGWESNAFPSASVFSKFKDKIYFRPIYESPIYAFDNHKKFELHIDTDFGRYNWPSELKTADDFDKDTKYSVLKGDYVDYIYDYQEKEDYWLFRYTYKGQMVFTVYDKASGKSTQYRPDVNEDKYFIGFGSVAGITEDYIITHVPAADVVRLLNGKDFNERYPQQLERLRQKVGDLDPNDNPVLIRYDI